MRRKNSIHNVYVGLGASNHTADERSMLDFYATPPLAVKHLLEVEEISHRVWEPACGMNHIADVLRENGHEVVTSDINDMIGDGTVEVVDFLNCDDVFDGDIVTNPPYAYATEFVYKALSLVREGHKVVMFLKIQFLEGKKRMKLFEKYPPKVIYVASSRYGCSKDGEFNSDGNTGSAICYAWYVWEKGFSGEPTLRWINR